MNPSFLHDLTEIAENLDLAVLLLDQDMVIRWANKSTTRLIGRSRAKAGQRLVMAWSMDQAMLRSAVKDVERTGVAKMLRVRLGSGRGGDHKWSICQVRSWVEGVMLVFQLETKLGSLESDMERLLQLETKKQLASAREVFWEMDFEGHGLTWSREAAEFFGAQDWECCRHSWKKWVDCIHPEDRVLFDEIERDVCEQREVGWSVACRVQSGPDRYRNVLVRGLALMEGNDGKERLLGSIVDLGELQEAETEVRRIRSQLIDVSGQKAMDSLASTLAHQINQPLAAVSNYLGGLERIIATGDLDMDVMLDAVGHAKKALEQSAGIIRHIRRAMERKEQEDGLIELRGVVRDAVAYVEAGLAPDSGVDIRQVVPRDIYVHGDYTQLQQVLVNLLRNGIAAVENASFKLLEVVATTEGEWVKLEVTDTGPGLPDYRVERVFEAYKGEKDRTLGVGLSVARTIVEAHDGRIRPERVEAGGTRFVVELPRADYGK